MEFCLAFKLLDLSELQLDGVLLKPKPKGKHHCLRCHFALSGWVPPGGSLYRPLEQAWEEAEVVFKAPQVLTLSPHIQPEIPFLGLLCICSP